MIHPLLICLHKINKTPDGFKINSRLTHYQITAIPMYHLQLIMLINGYPMNMPNQIP